MLSRPDLGVPPYLGYTGSVLDRAADFYAGVAGRELHAVN